MNDGTTCVTGAWAADARSPPSFWALRKTTRRVVSRTDFSVAGEEGYASAPCTCSRSVADTHAYTSPDYYLPVSFPTGHVEHDMLSPLFRVKSRVSRVVAWIGHDLPGASLSLSVRRIRGNAHRASQQVKRADRYPCRRISTSRATCMDSTTSPSSYWISFFFRPTLPLSAGLTHSDVLVSRLGSFLSDIQTLPRGGSTSDSAPSDSPLGLRAPPGVEARDRFSGRNAIPSHDRSGGGGPSFVSSQSCELVNRNFSVVLFFFLFLLFCVRLRWSLSSTVTQRGCPLFLFCVEPVRDG